MIIAILNHSSDTAYAASELQYFLLKYTNAEITNVPDAADKVISLVADTSMEMHHYSIHSTGTTMEIRGGNASSVLCGVCEALADAGIFFEANGDSVPHGFAMDTFFRINKDVQPKFRLRGIRQHINFPMDISSYHLEDAQEYIRALARMRYNAITFHSYPRQWHKPDPNNPEDYAGRFFYGQVHKIPTDDPLTASRVQNREYYCIPEVENVFENPAEKSEYAQYWLQQIMQTAKEAGLTITLSVEITSDDDDVNTNMLHTICTTYPMIDTLELICEESGGGKSIPDLTIEQVPDCLTKIFGTDILDADGKVPGLRNYLPHQLNPGIVTLSKLIRALEIRDRWLAGLEKVPALRGGLYITCEATLCVLRPILRKKLPEGVTMSLLPAHGSLAVANNINSSGNTSEDWQNTMYYSWAEFDGNMFIQQLETDGIEKLVSMPDTDSSYGFCINHWRTAENTLSISYTAEAAISGMSAAQYYAEYAAKLGITDTENFCEACKKLAWLNTYNRDNLFNIGFCHVGCWLNWCRRGNIMSTRNFPVFIEERTIQSYEEIISTYTKLLQYAETKEAVSFLRLMINRCETSILHIRSLMTLDELHEHFNFDNPGPLSSEQVDKINSIIERSRSYAKEYLHLYGEILPDRGCEGQLVSYNATTMVFINAVAANFTKENIEIYCNTCDASSDAPPMPDEEVK